MDSKWQLVLRVIQESHQLMQQVGMLNDDNKGTSSQLFTHLAPHVVPYTLLFQPLLQTIYQLLVFLFFLV